MSDLPVVPATQNGAMMSAESWTVPRDLAANARHCMSSIRREIFDNNVALFGHCSPGELSLDRGRCDPDSCDSIVIGGELQERLIPVPYSKNTTDQAHEAHFVGMIIKAGRIA
ncbi:hypothetical protein OUZ56_000281 [Daphnia magna]|uniref:Uncharacterized protein n=1 Tax=Daphnia magna TaxID=35525 RepID=A0ABQ9ZZ79_9CRUS|nr:hypothetical protein OUZ56_000281 [Daphnia magna]